MYNKVKDGYRWRCGKCKRERSAREESFFKDSNVTLPNWIRLIEAWSIDENCTINQLCAAAQVTETTVKGMLKSICEMRNWAVFDDRDCNVGGVGVPVIILPIGAICKENHRLLLMVDGNAIQVVHNQAVLPVKNGLSVFSNVSGVQGQVLNAAAVHPEVNSPFGVQDVKEG